MQLINLIINYIVVCLYKKKIVTHLGRQMGAAYSICTQVNYKHQDLHMGNWNVTSLNRNCLGKQSSIILILLEFPPPSVMALILLS